MRRYRSLPLLAVRRMRGNWRLLSSVALGTLIASAILSATVIYADAIRDLGLDFALSERPAAALDLEVRRSNLPVSGDSYARSAAHIDGAVGAALGAAAGGVIRQGTSATFYPTLPGVAPDLDDDRRMRANFRFRSELEQHVTITAGTAAPAAPAGSDGPIPVLMGAATAARNGVHPGDRFDLHPFWDEDAPPLTVEVTGLIEAIDPAARYWGADLYVIDDRTRSWETLLLVVPERTFFGALPDGIRTVTASYIDRYEVRIDALEAHSAERVAGAVETLEQRLGATQSNLRVESELGEVLRSFDRKLFFTRIPLFVLLLQVGGIVAYYLLVVSTMLVERHTAEIATLRSRGASTGQLLAQFGVEGVILALAAVLAGPPIAAAVIAALGPTPAFAALSGGGLLDVRVPALSYGLAAFGALIALGAFMAPAWLATRSTMVEFKRSTARPRPTPLLLRYYLDVALVLLLALLFWRLSREDQLLTSTLFGEARADPFLLSAPAVFMVTVGVVFLRLFPPVLRLAAWSIAQTRSVALLVGVRSLTRNPTHYARLILLLMFATGVGMFGATFSATLERSYEDRAAYTVGADVQAADFRALPPAADGGDRAFREAMAAVPAEAFSPLARLDGWVAVDGRSERVEFLGVEPSSLGKVALVRSDFADVSLERVLATLADNGATDGGLALPPGARRLGLWATFPEIHGRLSLMVQLRDGDGRTVDVLLGAVRPGDPATAQWRFFSADLARPLGSSGRPLRGALADPLRLQAVFIHTRSGVAAEQGIMRLGPVLATATGGGGAGALAEAAFPEAQLVHDLGAPAFEVIQGVRRQPVTDRVRPDPGGAADAPPGGQGGLAGAIRYQWQDVQSPPRRRGLRVPAGGEPVRFYLSANAARRLELQPGGRATLEVGTRFIEGAFAGPLERFPTYDVRSPDAAFAIVDGGRLLAAINAAVPVSPPRLTEAWFASTDPAVTTAALAAFDPQSLSDRASALAQQQQDPLAAAGWEGILAISFAAVLLLSTIGFLVYSYLTARERGLEFAILRTLGLSQTQIFSVVLVEHLFIVAAGIGLGTLTGLQVGSLMMEFMGATERGTEVLPPFQLQVSWREVAVVWGVLGTVFIATVATVVLLYLRVAVHRALRIADA